MLYTNVNMSLIALVAVLAVMIHTVPSFAGPGQTSFAEASGKRGFAFTDSARKFFSFNRKPKGSSPDLLETVPSDTDPTTTDPTTTDPTTTDSLISVGDALKEQPDLTTPKGSTLSRPKGSTLSQSKSNAPDQFATVGKKDRRKSTALPNVVTGKNENAIPEAKMAPRASTDPPSKREKEDREVKFSESFRGMAGKTWKKFRSPSSNEASERQKKESADDDKPGANGAVAEQPLNFGDAPQDNIVEGLIKMIDADSTKGGKTSYPAGIFRLSAPKSANEKVLKSISANGQVPALSDLPAVEETSILLAAVIKAYIRSFAETSPMLSEGKVRELLKLDACQPDSKAEATECEKQIGAFISENVSMEWRRVLAVLMKHLRNVAKDSERNLMDAENLAVTLAPNFFVLDDLGSSSSINSIFVSMFNGAAKDPSYFGVPASVSASASVSLKGKEEDGDAGSSITPKFGESLSDGSTSSPPSLSSPSSSSSASSANLPLLESPSSADGSRLLLPSKGPEKPMRPFLKSKTIS